MVQNGSAGAIPATLQSVPLTSSFGAFSVHSSDAHMRWFLSAKISVWSYRGCLFQVCFFVCVFGFFFYQECQLQLLAYELFPHTFPNLLSARKEKLTEAAKLLSEHSSSFLDLTFAIMHTENHRVLSR